MRKKKKQWETVLLIIVFLIGGGIFLYPTLSDQWNSYRNKKLIAKYQESVVTLNETDYSGLWEEAQEYNKCHITNTVQDAFDENTEASAMSSVYQKMLNPVGDGVMGYLDIPLINVQLPIFHGIGREVLEQGIGHMEGTSLPVGGLSTHAVLSGHRGLPSAKILTDLDQLQIGDTFYLIILDETLAYQVDQILTVLPDSEEALEAIAIESGEDLVTLITCTPYAKNTHRLLVRGKRIEQDEKEKKTTNSSVKEHEADSLISKELLMSVGVVLLFIILIIILRKKR